MAAIDRKRWKSTVLLLVLAIFLMASQPCWAAKRAPGRDVSGVITVERVVDGDTIVLNFSDGQESVRLIGIDTPESHRNKKAYKDSTRSGDDVETIIKLGQLASEHMRGLVKKGDRVKLELDVEPRDRYGRLLAYVFLSDGRMLNRVMLQDGYADLLTIPPNVKNVEIFRDDLRVAREKNKGLWGKK